MDRREGELEFYLDHYKDKPCRQATSQPSFTYIFVVGAIRLERMVDSARGDGREVEYHNTGMLFPNARAERIPYFIDAAHLSDKGADVLGRFYAQRILANTAKNPGQADFLASPSPRSSTARVSVLSASYGANCGASAGNVTYALRSACEGRETCDYLVDVNTLGDPATGCANPLVLIIAAGHFVCRRRSGGSLGSSGAALLCRYRNSKCHVWSKLWRATRQCISHDRRRMSRKSTMRLYDRCEQAW
jgi:hypothetical protein